MQTIRLRYRPALFAFWLLIGFVAGRPGLAAEGFSIGGTDGPALLTISAGSIGNIVASRDEAIAFGAEYRTGPSIELFFIRPSLGLIVTTDKSVYGYFGLSGDIVFWQRLILTPKAAVGGYSKGDGQDLGGTVQFMTGGALAWRFDNQARLGISLYHLSNADLRGFNPGTEVLSAFYSHPIDF